jgi:hypothetical protein
MTSTPQRKTGSIAQRLLWFVALWAGGVTSVTLVSYVLRLWIAPK